jgi:hypothetical protein
MFAEIETLQQFPYRLVAKSLDFHSRNPGSIPGRGVGLIQPFFFFRLTKAVWEIDGIFVLHQRSEDAMST